jgi:hypothetical protein
MDGRAQLPVIEYIKDKYEADYVDMITIPGASSVLAGGNQISVIESIKISVEISVASHGSSLVAVCGHYDCAANPADKETQIQHIKTAIKTINSLNLEVQIIGLWVNKNWQVEAIK